MSVLMPDGMVMAVEKATPVIEQRISFNDREVRLCERSADVTSANEIALLSKAGGQDICDVTMGGTALIGNISSEQVKGVLESLVREGYVNLPDLKLQKTQPLVSRYKFDNGASGAYLIFGYEASACFGAVPGYSFMGGAFPVMSKAKNSEDTGDAGDED